MGAFAKPNRPALHIAHRRACEQVRRSSRLRRVLATILSAGNQLNAGTPRGGAGQSRSSLRCSVMQCMPSVGLHTRRGLPWHSAAVPLYLRGMRCLRAEIKQAILLKQHAVRRLCSSAPHDATAPHGSIAARRWLSLLTKANPCLPRPAPPMSCCRGPQARVPAEAERREGDGGTRGRHAPACRRRRPATAAAARRQRRTGGGRLACRGSSPAAGQDAAGVCGLGGNGARGSGAGPSCRWRR